LHPEPHSNKTQQPNQPKTKRSYHKRAYVAYTTFWAIGGPLAMLVRFIGSNHVTSHELLAFNGLWLALQAWELLLWLRARLGQRQFAALVDVAVAAALALLAAGVGGIVLLTATGAADAGGKAGLLVCPAFCAVCFICSRAAPAPRLNPTPIHLV
jgi:hypothetical protein